MYYKSVQEISTYIILNPGEFGVPMWIPMDINNDSYQKFLIYLEENNLTIDDIPVWEP